MKETSYIIKNRKGLSKTAYIILAIIVLAAAAIVFFVGNSESCGNGICHAEKGETCKSCPQDCGPCQKVPVCGDGLCTGAENNDNCPADCKPSTLCGDGVCDPSENCQDCFKDCACGSGQYCSPALKACAQRPCGDGKCDSGIGEDCNTCPADCKECKPTPKCADGVCDPSENCLDCPQDCKCAAGEYCSAEEKSCVKPVCGNQKCEIYENSDNCCIDCPCEISYTKCNQETRACENPSTVLGDEEIKKIVAEYYSNKSAQVEDITLKEVFVWDGKTGRKTEVKLAGQDELKFLLVTDAKEVIELPFF